LRPWIENLFGLYLSGSLLTVKDLIYLLIILVSGVLIGFVPAYRAMRLSLKDGLSVKN
jgi:putative ABC transport system permease protein